MPAEDVRPSPDALGAVTDLSNVLVQLNHTTARWRCYRANDPPGLGGADARPVAVRAGGRVLEQNLGLPRDDHPAEAAVSDAGLVDDADGVGVVRGDGREGPVGGAGRLDDGPLDAGTAGLVDHLDDQGTLGRDARAPASAGHEHHVDGILVDRAIWTVGVAVGVVGLVDEISDLGCHADSVDLSFLFTS